VTSPNEREAQRVWQAACGVMGGGGASSWVQSAQGVYAGLRGARIGLVARDGVVEQVLGEASGLKLRLMASNLV